MERPEESPYCSLCFSHSCSTQPTPGRPAPGAKVSSPQPLTLVEVSSDGVISYHKNFWELPREWKTQPKHPQPDLQSPLWSGFYILIQLSLFLCVPSSLPHCSPQPACEWLLSFHAVLMMPFPSPGDLPNPGVKPASPAFPALQVASLPLSHWESPKMLSTVQLPTLLCLFLLPVW